MITSSSHYKAAVAAPRNANVFPSSPPLDSRQLRQWWAKAPSKPPWGARKHQGVDFPGNAPAISINIQFVSMIFPTCRGSIASSSVMFKWPGKAIWNPWGAQNFAGNSMPQWWWLQSYPAFIEDQNEGPPSCLIDFPTMGYHNPQ